MDGTDESTAGIPARLRKAASHLAFLAMLAAASPAAADHVSPGDRLGANLNDIANALSAHGYSTLRYINKDGRIEIVARKGGDEVFLLIDAETGILETGVHKDDEPLLERPPAAAPSPNDEESRRPATRDKGEDRLSALPASMARPPTC
jgi:hypothetical protein